LGGQQAFAYKPQKKKAKNLQKFLQGSGTIAARNCYTVKPQPEA